MRTAFALATRCIMRIVRDVGYVYLGTVLVTIGGVTYDLGDYLGLLASARWQPPSPVHPPAPAPSPKSTASIVSKDPELVEEKLVPATELLAPRSDPEFLIEAAVPLSPAGDSEHIISKSIDRLEIIEDMFARK
jgi:hypothetical protein